MPRIEPDTSGSASGCAFLMLMLAARLASSQPAPYHAYRTLETEHFRVHAAAGLEREGRVAAAAAERAYALLSRELVAPRGAIDLVVSDDADYANGNATPFPSNRINVFAAPPVDAQGLRFNDDWIQLVVTHELTHIFHLDRVRGVWASAQSVFGRLPFLFPNLYGPAWLTEGLAVYYESRFTAGGRLNEQNNRLIARAAARDGALPRLDQLGLGAPGFPGGEGVYDYGALFLEYLARTRGDSSIGRFVEAQSTQLIPFRLDRSAEQGLGISFRDAFAAWRDSVARSVDSITAPLPGWRELTTRSLYAPAPRWLNDSTIVYSATDGRATNAAYALTVGGARRRLGRRDGRGANVPLADGSLLYAALDYTGRAEVRSDLYRTWPDGHTLRLTTGARLIQPDARPDGEIVAVRLAAARASLVLLDPAGRTRRVLRDAAADETWSEPRWSADRRAIAAVRRTHGGEFSLEVIDLASDSVRVVERGRWVIASPSWVGPILFYTSESTGAPRLVVASPAISGLGALVIGSNVGVFFPEPSPHSGQLAAVSLRADGYHLGTAPLRLPDVVGGPRLLGPPARADTQQVAAGDYHNYSALRSVLPRYWYPVVEQGAVRGARLGIATSGLDVLGRHSFSAYAAVPTSSGEGATGALFYRYAGLRGPLLDLSLAHVWESQGRVFDTNGDVVGTLLKRTQDVAFGVTFVRPRMRTSSSVSGAIGLERRRFDTDPASLLARLDTTFARELSYPRVQLGGTWANAQRPALSISPEDGVALAVTARERLRTDAPGRTASFSVVGTTSGYKSLDLPGFAHHVLALRLAGGWADRRSASAFEVGGNSGGSIDLVPGYAVGEGRRTFSVRGFPSAAVYGTRAAAGSLEYRAPLVLGGRGVGLLPFFFDRASLTGFADAGVATCPTNALYASICSPTPLIGRTIASAGGELALSAALLSWDAPSTIRVGVAAPVAGREVGGAKPVSAYVSFGLSY